MAKDRSLSCAAPCSFSILFPLYAVSFLLFLLSLRSGNAFQSDELVEEEDEWGLVGRPSQQERVSVNPINVSPRQYPSEQPDNSAIFTKIEFPLQHAFGNSEFTEAGTFSARLKPSSRGGQTLVKIRLSRKPLSEDQMSQFQNLVKEDGFYSIRVPANLLNPGEIFVVSSTKARCLSASNFEERFDMYLDQGNILAVQYGSAHVCSIPREIKIPSEWSFSTLIVSKTGEVALKMSSVNDDLGNGVDEVGEDGTLVKKLPEKSFWAKYWMYIIPLGLIVVNAITQVANIPDEQNSGQAGGQGSGQGTPQRISNAGGARRR